MGIKWFKGKVLWIGGAIAWADPCCCIEPPPPPPPGDRDCSWYTGDASMTDANVHASGVTINIVGFSEAAAFPPAPIVRKECCEAAGGNYFLPVRDFDDPLYGAQSGCGNTPCAAFAEDTCGAAECYFDPGLPEQEEYGWRIEALCSPYLEGYPFWTVNIKHGVMIADPEGPPDPPFICDFVSQANYQILSPPPPYPTTHAGLFGLTRIPDPFFNLASPQCCTFPDTLVLYAPS
jgi:hypothetical protein